MAFGKNFDVQATLRAETGPFNRAMKGASNAIKGLKNEANSLTGIGNAVSGVGKALTAGITVPVAGAIGASVALGASFEDQMSTVGAVTNASASEMEALENSAREMGQTTRYSATEAAGAQENLARAGFNTSEIMDALGSTLDLATSGSISLDEASSITARTIRGFGLEASDASRVADVLAKTAADSNTTVSGLGETFKYVAPVASSLGLGFEEVAAAAGIMGDAGIEAGQAGRVLRRGLLNLADPTAQQKALMDELGLSFFDANGEMKPMKEIVGELETGLAGMSDEQKTAALATLFGSEAVSGWTALVNAGSDALGEFQNGLENSTGFAEEFARQVEDNLSGSFREFKSSLGEVGLTIFDLIEGPLRSLIDSATEALDAFIDLDEGTQKNILKMIGLAAAIGPVLWILGKLLIVLPHLAAGLSLVKGGVTKLAGAFQAGGAISAFFGKALGLLKGAFAFLISPIGLVIAAIAIFIGVMIYLYHTNETVREFIVTAWENIQETIGGVIEAIAGFILDIWGAVSEWFLENQDTILQFTQTVWGIIQSVFEVVWNAITSIVEAALTVIVPIIKGAWEVIKTITSVIWSVIKGIIGIALTVILGIITTIMHIINGDWEAAWETIKEVAEHIWEIIKGVALEVFEAIADLISQAWEYVKEKTSEIWTSIKEWLSEKWENLKTKVIEVFTGIKDKITEAWNKVKDKTSEIWNNITTWLSDKWEGLKETVSDIFGSIKNKVFEIWSKIKRKTSEIWNNITEIISDFLDTIFSTFEDIFGDLFGVVVDAFNDVVEAVSDGMSDALDAVTDFFDDFVDAGKNLVGSIADGIRGAIDTVTGAIGDVVGAIRDFLPFSPPKDKSSPLVGIENNNIVGQIAKGINRDEDKLATATSSALDRVQGILNQRRLNANLGLRNAVDNANAQVNSHMNHEFSNLELDKQPMQVNLSIGGQNFTAFVDNISQEQGRQTDLELQF